MGCGCGCGGDCMNEPAAIRVGPGYGPQPDDGSGTDGVVVVGALALAYFAHKNGYI